MEPKDVLHLGLSLVTPVLAVVATQMVIAKRERNNRTMQLFYDLVGHLNAYKMAFYGSASNARRREDFLIRYDQSKEQINELLHAKPKIVEGVMINTPLDWEFRNNEIRKLQAAIGQEDKESNEEGMRYCAQLRLASSALAADCLLLEMLFHAKAHRLIASLNSLRSSAEMFEGRCPDYVAECLPMEKELPGTIERIQKQVTEFWKIEIREQE